MKLRTWQQRCTQQAISHYQYHPHFFCLATPGAGKTITASEIAKKLREQNKIDFILCFSPSIEVANSMRATFHYQLGECFNGVIGSIGASYTYSKLLTLPASILQIIEKYRVLVVLDEVHHCAGSDLENSNAWGQEILLHIQNKATYTLALSGTPWRSDKRPIVLSKYLEPDGQIECNYQYGLSEAIQDDVCCVPQIILVDNDAIRVKSENSKIYSSFKQLIADGECQYQDIISSKQVMEYILTSAHKKLLNLRSTEPSTAGLVVASSIEHAYELKKILQEKLNATVVIVNYTMNNSSYIIDEFRHSDDEWIVSIGMVSEGTDIPRLKVCCYLSHIRTELYFRQVLGRIIRKTECHSSYAWLYVLNEQNLAKYAYQIAEDLPKYHVLIKTFQEEPSVDTLQTRKSNSHETTPSTLNDIIDILENSDAAWSAQSVPKMNISVANEFSEKILNLFMIQ